MKKYIQSFSHAPNDFINEFYPVLHNYYDTSNKIRFHSAIKWLESSKDRLMELLMEYHHDIFDYTTDHNNHNEIIFISSQCFKDLCFLVGSNRTKQVKKWFMDIENLVRKYKMQNTEMLRKKIIDLKNEQKKLKNKEFIDNKCNVTMF